MEKVICASIHKPGEEDLNGNPLIYCGLRHAYILWQSKSVSRHPHHQGFITSKNRHVNREEAREIALKAGQITENTYSSRDLYSEDIY